MYKYILLDLDNTVLDFNASEEKSFYKVMQDNRIKVTADHFKKYQIINSNLWKQLERGLISKQEVLDQRFTLFFEDYNIDADGVEAEKEFRSYLNQSSDLIEDALLVLQRLEKEKHKIYAATNGVYHTQLSRMINADIIKYFDTLFISEVVGYEKPSLNYFDHCLRHLPTNNIKEVLMVGDSLSSDILGAKAAGIDTCHFHESPSEEATYGISKLMDLLEYT